jgi:4-amino-4-deoxy-L-arabinose transferase-like glycosyltransferase
MNRRSDWNLTLFALGALALIVLLGKADESTLPASDAATHAALAMSATAQGILPHFPIGADAFGGQWGKGYNDYPFAFFYLNGWIMRLFGPCAWSAKLLPSLFSTGTVLLTAILGMRWESRMAGVLAGLILLFTRDFILDSVNCHLDNVLAFFILLSLLLWEKKRYLWAGVIAGVGTWFKSPVAFLIFPVLVFSSIVRQDLRQTAPRIARCVLLAVLVSFLVWIPPALLGGWELMRDYWVRQVWGTAIQGRGEQSLDLLAFFRILRGRYLPWTLPLIWGVYFTFRRRKWRSSAELTPYLGAAIVIAMISFVRYKHDHYFTPAYPFLSIIAARPGAVLLARFETALSTTLLTTALAIAVLLLCSPVSLSPESFPALKRFMAIIQSSGDCSERVLFVEGGEPYGSAKDYRNLIGFYTGRHLDDTECPAASDAASKAETAWVLISKENAEKCLSPAVRSAFPASYSYGSQLLLSRRSRAGETLDLSPLGRELKAATDCRPAPLPSDRYQGF